MDNFQNISHRLPSARRCAGARKSAANMSLVSPADIATFEAMTALVQAATAVGAVSFLKEFTLALHAALVESGYDFERALLIN